MYRFFWGSVYIEKVIDVCKEKMVAIWRYRMTNTPERQIMLVNVKANTLQNVQLHFNFWPN